ncbi:hypothetical protein ScPMuIL_015589 [Solemya velum]
MCLNKEKHSQDAILQAIRMSLKGEAGRVLMRLGPKATVDSIVRKMNSVYGEVDQTEMVLAKFYSAKQQPDEDVSSWGCRLEDLLNSAIEKGKVTSSESNDMLRVKFWSGLKESIQDITGYLYERIEDFDDLRIAIRRIEQNHKQPTDEKDSRYNSSVPILLGTNLLLPLMEDTKTSYGENFLQSTDLQTPLYLAFRCMLLRDRELDRRKGRLAVIKSAEKSPLTIMPNSEVVIHGFLDKLVPYQPVCCMVHPTKKSAIPDDLDLTPTLIPYNYKQNGIVQLQITNISTRTVTIQPKALLCELQPVKIEDISTVEADSIDEMEEIDICEENLDSEELKRARDLVLKQVDIDGSSVNQLVLPKSQIPVVFRSGPNMESESDDSASDEKNINVEVSINSEFHDVQENVVSGVNSDDNDAEASSRIHLVDSGSTAATGDGQEAACTGEPEGGEDALHSDDESDLPESNISNGSDNRVSDTEDTRSARYVDNDAVNRAAKTAQYSSNKDVILSFNDVILKCIDISYPTKYEIKYKSSLSIVCKFLLSCVLRAAALVCQ